MLEIRNTLFVGRKVVLFDSLPSTNSWLIQRLTLENLPEGTIVIARNQTSGRGQRGNNWFSQAGNSITFSLLLNPRTIEPDKQFAVSQAISLAIHDLLEQCQIPGPTVKWPNDIMSGDHKIGGILIENTLRGNLFQNSVIGIGLNINQMTFPPELGSATSFKLSSGIDFSATNLLEELCQLIEKRYMQLRAGKLRELELEYLSKMYRNSDWYTFQDDNGVFKGKISGLNSKGQIQVSVESGEIRSYSNKEIKFL